MVELAAHLLHQFLCAFGFARKIVQIHGVMAGLVAVGVLPDETAGVTVHLATGGGQTEVLIKLLQEAFFATKEVDETLRIVWHEPHVLPSVAFHKAGLLIAERVKALYPIAFLVLRTEEASLGVKEVFVIHTATEESFIGRHFIQLFGNSSHTGIIEALLKGDADAGVLQCLRHIAILLPNLEGRIEMAAGTALEHSVKGLIHIDTRKFCHDSVGQHRDGMVANHAVIVLPPKVPDGQITVSLVV